jgi:hypothetical protein
MLEMRLRDTRFALLGPRSGAQAAVKSATGFAFNWGFLARGASTGFGDALFQLMNVKFNKLM